MFGRLLVVVSCLTLATPSFAALTGTVMNVDGQPLPGARLSAYALETGAEQRVRLLSDKPARVALAVAESATTGRFSLDWPKDHPVAMLQLELAGHAPHSVRVERDDDIGALALVLAPAKTGRITSGGKPVAGARVVVSDQSEVIATTDQEGRYSVPDPEKWANRIGVLHADHAIYDDWGMRRQTSLSLDHTLTRGTALTGRVVGRDGRTPIAGAQIFLNGWPVATSGEGGAFTVAHAPEKWEWISARHAAMSGRRARGSDLTIRLQPTIPMSGVVRDAKSSLPIAGAEVMLLPASRFAPGTTPELAISDAKGNFTFPDVAAGSYNMMTNRPGYGFEPVAASVGATTASRTVLGRRLGRIAGTVLDEQKLPVSGARVRPQTVTRGGGPMVFTSSMALGNQAGISAPDGTFTIRVEADSDLQIEAAKKGFPSARTPTLRVAEGERKRGVVITIPSGIVVSGKVTDRDGKALAGVKVTAADARAEGGMQRMMLGGRRGREDDVVQSAADGTFSLQLKEGTYDLAFRRQGYATRTVRGQDIRGSVRPLQITLDPGVEITGRVTRNSAPVAGVTINAFGEGQMETTESGADGTFRLADLTPGSLMLMASKPDEFIQHNRPVTAPARDVEIEVPAGGRVMGRVIDKETKAPVNAFEAGVSGARAGGGGMMFMGPNQLRPFTSDDGTFVLENVPVGQTTLVVNAAGYTSTRVPSITVEEGRSTAEIEVAMDRGVKVTGRVTGPDGSALAGVGIRHTPAESRQMRPPSLGSAAVTDSNGDYTIEAIEPGKTQFVFSRAGYVTTEKTSDLEGRDVRLDAQLSTGIRVSGTVMTDGGAPVADAHVSANSPSGASSNASTRTDQNGAFQLDAMAPGRYSFYASKQGYPRTTLTDIDIAAGGPVRLVLKGGGTIYGRVIGLSAEEMGTATVSASNNNGSSAAPVDSTGNFRIEGAPVGTVRLVARTGGAFAMGGRTSAARSVQVEAGGSVQQDVEFTSDTVVRGRVTRDGQPVGNVMVAFFPQSSQAQTSARTQADASGQYEVSGLDDAKYSVSVVDMQRNASFNTTYEVRGSGTFDIDMRSTSVRGRVVDASTGQPIVEAAVELRESATDGPRFRMRMVQTDAAGAFLLENVPPGTWNIAAEKAGYGTKLTEVNVGSSPAEIEIKLSPNAGVSIRVVDARDGRSLDAFIRVMDSKNRIVYESPMRFGGMGSSEEMKIGLEPGTYRATVTAQNYATRVVAITSPGSQTIGMTPGGSLAIRSKGSEIRRGRLMGADGREYTRFFNPIFTIDPSPGVTQLNNIAPGAYTLQILGPRDEVIGNTQVMVTEGQVTVAEI